MTTHLRTALGTMGMTALVGLAATGCEDASSKGTMQEKFPPMPNPAVQQGSALTKAQSCDDLLKMLKADAEAKLYTAVDEQIKRVKTYGASNLYGNATGGGTIAVDDRAVSAPEAASAGTTNGNSTGSTGAVAPSAPGSSGATSGATKTSTDTSSASAATYSQTNTQVAGVDEADIVKTDGKNVYVLHGDAFLVVRAWPVADLTLATQAKIEGSPLEMFVENNVAVVYSTVNGAEIFKAAGVTPKSTYNDHIAYAVSEKGALAIDPGRYEFPTPGAYVPLTKVTVLKIDGAAASVTSELYFEGDYTSARRVGTQVRTVLNGGAHGPVVNSWPTFGPNEAAPTGNDGWIAAFEKVRADGLAVIAKSTISDWLPYSFTKSGAAVAAKPLACDSYYVPPAGSTDYGLVQIQAFDVNTPGSVSGASIVGHSEVVYGSTDNLYLTATAWSPLPPFEGVAISVAPGVAGGTTTGIAVGEPAPTGTSGPIAKPAPLPSPEPTPVPPSKLTSLTKTQIHKFSLAGNSGPVYAASGSVPGNVLNQFSLDEHEGFLRVTTTEDQASDDYSYRQRINHLFVLATQEAALATVGDVGELAKGETIFSTRFVGDRGYVVTSVQQMDPLFVVDLKDPHAPKVLGELKIPGFSNYMHPIDPTHLLTIGQDGNRSLELKIFDVSDALNPKVACDACQFSYQSGASSEAQFNHKAFTYYAAQGLLAFPLTSYGYSNGNFDYGGYKSTLELFQIDAAKGIIKKGSVDHSSLIKQQVGPSEPCGPVYLQQATVQRGLFLEDALVSVSTGGLLVNRVQDLGFEGSVAFPVASYNEVYSGNGGKDVAIAPAPSCVPPTSGGGTVSPGSSGSSDSKPTP